MFDDNKSNHFSVYEKKKRFEYMIINTKIENKNGYTCAMKGYLSLKLILMIYI